MTSTGTAARAAGSVATHSAVIRAAAAPSTHGRRYMGLQHAQPVAPRTNPPRKLARVSEPLTPSRGWAVLHLFAKSTAATDRETLATTLKRGPGEGYQLVTVALLGHKADVALMIVGPDVWRLREFQTAVQQAGLDVVASYVSLSEESEYAQGMPEEAKRPRL